MSEEPTWGEMLAQIPVTPVSPFRPLKTKIENVSPAAAPCPKCDKVGNMQYQWKPDLEPERERLRCYGCGWDTGWIRYGTCRVRSPA